MIRWGVGLRLVAREFRGEEEAMYAATPPLEMMRVMLSLAASRRGHKVPYQLGVLDVSRAFFQAECHVDTFVALPPELRDQHPGMCWKLRKAMYGTRPAAQAWQKEYSKRMESWGFERNRSNPCCLYSKSRDLRVFVLGSRSDVVWFHDKMKAQYEVKVKSVLGEGAEDDKEARILNRRVSWGAEGISYEADEKHAKQIIEDLGLKGASPVTTPIIRKGAGQEENTEELTKEEAKRFRGIAARINYIALDRADLQYAAKEVCRKMSKPVMADWDTLKRIGRYLLHRPRAKLMYKCQRRWAGMKVYTDANHAGCLKTKKSSSSGHIMLGRHCVKSWSSTQAVIALSSGESEYYSLVKGASEALGLRNAMRDWNLEVEVDLATDSSAALGIASRLGLNNGWTEGN